MDNINQEQLDQLDDYLNQNLDEAAFQAVAAMLSQQPEMRKALEELKIAKAVISMNGLQQRVSAHHKENMKVVLQHNVSDSQGGAGRVSYLRPALRVAAALLALIFMGGLIQFFLLDNTAVYNENFMSYNLPVTRNEETANQRTIDSLFRLQQYEEVIKSFRSGDSSDNFSRFLAAMSYMETGSETEAISLFNAVKENNAQATSKTFDQESDYYLMLAYIKSGQEKKALQVLDGIRSDKRHLYHKNFSQWEIWKLQLLSLKD